MSEAIRPQGESLASILERAIEQAQASPKAKEAAAKYGKPDVAEAVRTVVDVTKEGLANGSDLDGERQYLRSALRDCGVSGPTADLFTQMFFKKYEPEKGLFWHLRDVFKNTGG